MSTWKCLQYVLVCFLGSHTLKWSIGDVYIGSPQLYPLDRKLTTMPSGAPDYPMPWPCQPTVEVCSNRLLDPTVT
jgi:hypothetical protein